MLPARTLPTCATGIATVPLIELPFGRSTMIGPATPTAPWCTCARFSVESEAADVDVVRHRVGRRVEREEPEAGRGRTGGRYLLSLVDRRLEGSDLRLRTAAEPRSGRDGQGPGDGGSSGRHPTSECACSVDHCLSPEGCEFPECAGGAPTDACGDSDIDDGGRRARRPARIILHRPSKASIRVSGSSAAQR